MILPQDQFHAVVPGSPDDYGRTHPARPALTVEVAESSLGVDRQHKGSLYARAASARVTPLAAPAAGIRVSDLLP